MGANRTRRPPVRIIRNEKKRPRSVTRARPGKIKFYGPRKRNVIARVPRRAANAHTASSVMVIVGIGGMRTRRKGSIVCRARARSYTPFNYKLTALIRKLASSSSLVFSRQPTTRRPHPPPLQRYYHRRRSTGTTYIYETASFIATLLAELTN